MSDRELGYLRFLPAIYSSRAGADPTFLERYLWIVQAILGDKDANALGVQKGMGEVVNILPSLLYPRFSFLFPDSTQPLPQIVPIKRDGSVDERAARTNLQNLNNYLGIVPLSSTQGDSDAWETAVLAWLADFLDWLASWLAFLPDAAWSVDTRRAVLVKLMLAYRQRGTRVGLQALTAIFFPDDLLTVIDLVDAPPILLGENSWLADEYTPGDGVLDATRPFSFMVELGVPSYDFDDPKVIETEQNVRKLIDAEKPINTRWVFQLRTITFTIGKYSTIGVNTLIPKEPVPESGAKT